MAIAQRAARLDRGWCPRDRRGTLFFNAGGQRAPLTAERLGDVREKGVTMNGESAESLGVDANLLMLIQVPLEIRPPAYRPSMALKAPMEPAANAGMSHMDGGRERRSGMETAVLGHGPELGPFVELDGKTLTRDPRFPVRVTVQFYQATSSGRITRADVARGLGLGPDAPPQG